MPNTKVRVKKPKALLFDVAKNPFIEKVLCRYVYDNVKTYLEENWGSDAVLMVIEQLRTEANERAQNHGYPKPTYCCLSLLFNLRRHVPQIPFQAEPAALINATVSFVQYCVRKQITSRAITQLQFNMWFDALKRDRLKAIVSSDLDSPLKHKDRNIRLFVFSSRWIKATDRFLE